ncbi:unnamed protein product [Adineta ricciae]|uniref:Major facilitator superfamily (MFS) profile domain-containing protein n=1 Tax=Adineta ricciae TaxID=249248 RepID=A0A814RAC9_ADIRI|nr:unnamed protein product [Adineta ricciae]CAF1130807.1 unnamed protein product [Adineta ricciae]
MDEISLENVLRRCGDFGRFQLIHFSLLCLLNFSSGMAGFYYVFALAEPYFRCRLPSDVWPNDNQYSSSNSTHQQLIDTLLMTSSSCKYTNGSSCQEFVFDRSVYGKTFTEEAKFVCENAIRKTWISTVYELGTFTVLITGPISDRVGRRKMLQILSLGMYIVTAITQLLLQFVSMSANLKIGLLMVNQIVSGIDPYGIVFLLLMELTSSSHTSFAGGVSMVAYTIGEVMFTGFAYAARNWLNLKWFMSIYFAVTVPYLFFIPESPYWLFIRKKYDQLEVCLRKIAKTNRREESEWHPMYMQLVEQSRLEKTTEKKKPKKKISRIIRLIPRLFMCGCIEFVTMLLYTTISYDLGQKSEAISPYTNFIIGAGVEGLGYLAAGLCIITFLGRKYSLIMFVLLTAGAVLAIPFVTGTYPVVATVISQVGKFGVSAAVSVSWLFVPELFPTYMRGLANAIFVFVGSFGSMLAPIIDTAVGDEYQRITNYVYAGLAVVLACVIATLPETRNRSFQDGKEHDEEDDDDDEEEGGNTNKAIEKPKDNVALQNEGTVDVKS